MGWIKSILGAGGETLATPITAVGNVIDQLFTSKDEKLTHEEILMRLMMQPDIAQTEVNKIESQHRTIFVAGWRPFIGWVCGIALFYSFILRDIVSWLLTIFNPDVLAPPELAMEHLMTVLLGMLGLGGMRTYEKLKGKSK